jgi:hypothetical protein
MSSRSRASLKNRLVRQEGNRNLLSFRIKTKTKTKSRSRSPKSEYAKTSSRSRATKHRVSYSRAGSVRRVGYSAVRSRVNYANPLQKAKSIRTQRGTMNVINE